MIVKWQDGYTATGATARDLVEDMRRSGIFTASKTTGEYMRGVARRVSMGYGLCRHDSPEHFIDDLLRIGLITLVTEH